MVPTGEVLLASNEWRPGILLDLLQCTGQISAIPPPTKCQWSEVQKSCKRLAWGLALSLHIRKPVTLQKRPCDEATWK